jgi:hypothetical protein
MFSSATIDGAAARGGARCREPSRLLALPRLLRQRVSTRLATLLCCVLGVCLLSPSLISGLVADDYFHELMLRDDPGLHVLSHGPLDLFRFADGHPESVRALIDEGVFPWWVDPKVVLAFFRPLSSLSHFIDYQLWPSQPFLMHLHSLLWFGVLIAIVAAVYRRFGAASHGFSLALLLFAIDDAHAPLVGWVANRNALIALCFALPALLVHDRQRRSDFVHGVWLGPLSFSLGLLAGEVAIGVFAYLVAYAACFDRGRWSTRWGSLLPYALVVLGWKLSSAQLGYGAFGSGLYVDPLSQPIRFLGAACERLPVLGLGLVAAPFADFWELYPLFSPWLRVGVMLLALLVLGTFGLVLWPLMRHRPRLHFWATGTALSLLPLCATFPHDRLLIGPGIGAMAVIAEMIEFGWARRHRFWPALGVGALIGIHLVLAPVLAPLRAASVGHFSDLLRATDETLPSGPAVKSQTLILLNPPLDPFAAYLPVYREAAGRARPRQQLWLATGASDLFVTTVDPHSLAIRPDGGFLANSMQLMLRSKEPGLARGERVMLDGASVQVTELTPDGRPLQIVVSFERALDDPSLVWMRWQRAGYAPFVLPAVGKTVVLPKAAIFDLLFDS